MVIPKPSSTVARPKTRNLQDLVAHTECIPSNLSLADAVERFRRSAAAYFAVCDRGQVPGLISRESIGLLYGGGNGFALFASQPASSRMEPEFLAVRQSENVL